VSVKTEAKDAKEWARWLHTYGAEGFYVAFLRIAQDAESGSHKAKGTRQP